MKTIGERFKKIIETENMNAFSFSKRIGVSNTAIAKIIKGESKPGYDVMESVLQEFPNLNTDWLMNGNGEMWKEVVGSDNRPDNYLQSHLKNLEEQFSRLNQQLEVKDRQIERLMDLLGKHDDVVGETKTLQLNSAIGVRA